MAEVLNWKVVRGHLGERWYEVGETRTGTRAELGHLAPNNLELIVSDLDDEEGEKSEDTPQNKAEGAAPANKAAIGRGRKGA